MLLYDLKTINTDWRLFKLEVTQILVLGGEGTGSIPPLDSIQGVISMKTSKFPCRLPDLALLQLKQGLNRDLNDPLDLRNMRNLRNSSWTFQSNS